ncbi:hypothetical protein KLER11_gp04 [Pararheinheimera phage vB_PsoM_KLER1-1]|nr:hypothetical protein KLER11_gp04 [Pararheinheimera phage vB_PsoM_KLER1-1]
MSENLIDWTQKIVTTDYEAILKQPDFSAPKHVESSTDKKWEIQIRSLINYGLNKGFILVHALDSRPTNLVFYQKSIFQQAAD